MTTLVILAAGLGSRLRPLTNDRPKCLVSVAGETILLRALRLAAAWGGAKSAVVVTGYHADAVAIATRNAPIATRCVYVPEHAQTQNSVSLLRALEVAPDGDIIKLDGDLVFSPGLFDRLSKGVSHVAVDRTRPVRNEAMKVTVTHGTVDCFGKALSPERSDGESIGAERLDTHTRVLVHRALCDASKAHRTDLYYEDVYNTAIAAGARFVPCDVTDLPWAEVDDMSDLERANARFTPNLRVRS